MTNLSIAKKIVKNLTEFGVDQLRLETFNR